MACNNQCSNNNQAPQSYDFLCVAGDDFGRQLQFVDSVTEQPIANIDEIAFYMSIYQSWAAKIAGDEPLIYLDSESGNFPVVSIPEAKINMLISRAETGLIEFTDVPVYDMNIPQNVCVYDLIGVDADGDIQTEMRGTFTFQMKLTSIPDVT